MRVSLEKLEAHQICKGSKHTAYVIRPNSKSENVGREKELHSKTILQFRRAFDNKVLMYLGISNNELISMDFF